MIRVNITKNENQRITQGDIFKDIEYIEYVVEKEGVIEVSKIVFPFVIVLTQDCDLEQDYNSRAKSATSNNDKWLLSVLVAPIYNVEHVYIGEHLSELGLKMENVPKKGSSGSFLITNQRPRYHYLNFEGDVLLPSVIDFKHYFSVNVNLLTQIIETNFVCSVAELYREDISQRFASFLSRIGLP